MGCTCMMFIIECKVIGDGGFTFSRFFGMLEVCRHKDDEEIGYIRSVTSIAKWLTHIDLMTDKWKTKYFLHGQFCMIIKMQILTERKISI